MKQAAPIGNNRTGVLASDGRADAMQAEMERYAPSSQGTPFGAGVVRAMVRRETEAGLGTMPPPSNLQDAGLKEGAKAVAKRVSGTSPALLMDKLGQRLAFERMGTRLYEALLFKLEADGGYSGGPTKEGLQEILNEEHRHFVLLTEAIKHLAGDPTAMTPSADLSATASQGLLQVITDARTSLMQGLEAILIAELTDLDGWGLLGQLARGAGEMGLAEQFEEAERREEVHLRKVRTWIKAGLQEEGP